MREVRHNWVAFLTGILAMLCFPVRGGETTDLTGMSLEDLMGLEVTSVSKQKQKLSDAPAAVTVITQMDIHRSGMSTIPDLLRLSPGMQVGRVNSNKVAVSARGFNDLYANKLLVLMDGRTLYQPLFSGVYWEVQDTVLEDLDRIEVIRGPGATMWGANAVNGVINITTKSADQTQGWLLSGRAATEEGSGAVRYGGKLGDDTYYRVFGKYRYVDAGVFMDGSRSEDDAEMPQAGFRVDHFATEHDTFTISGQGYHSENGNSISEPTLTPPFAQVHLDSPLEAQGGHVLAKWKHVESERSDWSVQVYYDRFDNADRQLHYLQDTADIEFQHRFALSERQELIWGAGYRYLSDDMDSAAIRVDPENRTDYLASAFVQDRITVLPEKLDVWVGSKFEVNSYTGFEVQPAVMGLWKVDPKQSVWGSVMRAVRTPSRFEEDGRLVLQRGPEPTTGLPFSAEAFGNRSIKSEELWAFEAGYRAQPAESLSVDVAGFFNVYDDLRSARQGNPAIVPGPPPHVLVPLEFQNDIEAETWGVEVAANWQVNEAWRLSGSWSYIREQAEDDDANDPFSKPLYTDSSPRNQVQLRSYYNVTRDIDFNVLAFYVDRIERYDFPSYIRLDANLAWRFAKGAELTLGVQNALDGEHPEAGSIVTEISVQAQRVFYAQLTWTF